MNEDVCPLRVSVQPKAIFPRHTYPSQTHAEVHPLD